MPRPTILVVLIAALAACLGCQSFSGAADHAIAKERATPLSDVQRAAYRRVLSKSRVAILRAEAARALGEDLADDKASVWAVSLALTDGDPGVRRDAHRAIRTILDSRRRDRSARRRSAQRAWASGSHGSGPLRPGSDRAHQMAVGQRLLDARSQRDRANLAALRAG